MAEVLEYIVTNYTWLLIGAIIILLAIIGSYAEKTNFGQGKEKLENDKNNLDANSINSEIINDMFEENTNDAQVGNNNINVTDEVSEPKFNNNDNTSYNGIPENQTKDKDSDFSELSNPNTGLEENTQEVEINEKDDFDENFNKFDEEFNTLLPKKDIIDNDMLDDIDNLSLDKTQKIGLNDIPDLDDLELPRIKNLKDECDNIWKF